MKLEFLLRTWNNGMVARPGATSTKQAVALENQVWAREYWNVDFKRKVSFINFPVKRNFSNKLMTHFPRTPGPDRNYSLLIIEFLCLRHCNHRYS